MCITLHSFKCKFYYHNYLIVFNFHFINSLSILLLYFIIYSFLSILTLLFEVENINIINNLLYNLIIYSLPED